MDRHKGFLHQVLHIGCRSGVHSAREVTAQLATQQSQQFAPSCDITGLALLHQGFQTML